MEREIRFITTEREDLFHISRVLAEAIPAAFLSKPQDPVIVSVRGGFNSGKKIFADAVRDTLLPGEDNRILIGRRNYDETWRGKSDKGALEVAFMNAAWAHGYTDEWLCHYMKDNVQKVGRFLKQRKHGGISFIHNDMYTADEKAWITIWTESRRSRLVDRLEKPHIKTAGPEAQFHFNRLSKPRDWVRYTELTIRRDELFEAPQMQEALAKLTESTGRVHALLEKRANTYVYSDHKPEITLKDKIIHALGWR